MAKEMAVSIDELGFPRSGEKLCDLKGDWRFNAFVRYEWNDQVEWLHYIEGYRLAAIGAVEQVIADRHKADKLVFPIVFLFRQHIELCLKTILIVGNKLFGHSYPLQTIHVIGALWPGARKILERRWGTSDPSLIQTVEDQLLEFERIDKRSFAFRYPVDTTGEATSHPHLEKLNLKHFGDVASRLGNFLESCAEGLWCELGERVDMESELRSIYGNP